MSQKISSRENKCKIFGKHGKYGHHQGTEIIVTPPKDGTWFHMGHAFKCNSRDNPNAHACSQPTFNSASAHACKRSHLVQSAVRGRTAVQGFSRLLLFRRKAVQRLLTSNLGHLEVCLTRGGHCAHTVAVAATQPLRQVAHSHAITAKN